MTLFSEAYLKLQEQDVKLESKGFWDYVPKRPDREVHFNLFNVPKTRQRNVQKTHFAKILAFIKLIERRRFSTGISLIRVSCTRPELISIFGSSMQVSNAIKLMKEIGLIASYDETYQFNAFYDKDNRCKEYAWNKDNEDIFKQYCDESNINVYKYSKARIERREVPNPEGLAFDIKQVKFSSKLQLLRPRNMDKTIFEQFLTNCLLDNYPQLQEYKDRVDFINDTFYKYDTERQISFNIKYTWNNGSKDKAVKKIGIRATNSLVSAKKTKEENDPEWISYREDLLKQYRLTYEFDVKSSVPRITYLLNKGIWLDNSIDLYEEMFNTFIALCPSERMEWNKQSREMFKYFHMRGYFDSYTMISAHTKRAISLKGDYDKEKWSRLDEVMSYYKQSIEMTLGGKLYDSEIFFHESCIYIDVLFELLKRNYNVLQIYDGFYLDKECSDIQDIVKCKAYEYYLNNIQSNINKDINKIKGNKENIKINKEILNNNNNMLYNTIVKIFKTENEENTKINENNYKVLEKPKINKEFEIESFKKIDFSRKILTIYDLD